MSQPITVAVIVGSLRKDSINRRAAKAIASLAPAHVRFNIVEIGDLALYNQDFDALDPQPAGYVAFRDAIRAADAVLLVTPEYNRSIPGGLKNALDVGSRPWGKNVFAGKPAAVVSASISAIGGFGAHHDLKRVAGYLNMPMLNQPEVYLSSAAEMFGADGSIQREDTKTFLKTFVDAFTAWIEKTRA